jgi:hypothetical protein
MNSSIFSPKVNDPLPVLTAIDLDLETFTGELLNQGRGQKGCDHDQTLVGLEGINPFADFREGLDAAPQQVAHIESFELG